VTTHSAFHPIEVSERFCLGCGYNLRGLAGGRCPECGRAIDTHEHEGLRAPWVDRSRIGVFAAYWRTAALVTFRPGEFVRRFHWPRVRYHGSHLFRLWTIGWATAAVTFCTAALAWRANLAATGTVVLLGAMLPAAALFLYSATELTGFFTGPRLPSDTSEEVFRAQMIGDYALAALAWTPVPAVVCCAGVGAGKMFGGLMEEVLFLLAAALAAWVALLWLTGVLVLFGRALSLRPPVLVFFPVRVAGLAILVALFVFAPLACGIGGLISLTPGLGR
jgi:hypothetical protein